MRGELGSRFDARATRQALPAARCLLVLSKWLPLLGETLRQLRHDGDAWQVLGNITDEELAKAGSMQMPNPRVSLARVFDRFLRDYRSL
jgi:hypothetical protein